MKANAEGMALPPNQTQSGSSSGGLVTARHARLYASAEELQRGRTVRLYEPVVTAPDQVREVVLQRDGLDPFVSRDVEVRRANSHCFVDAAAAPGGQITYEYMLLREMGVLDCETRTFAPSPKTCFIGMTAWDRMEVDCEPGMYYVSARNDSGNTAYLLGPFEKHIDALARVRQASLCAINLNPIATWFRYGTVRWNGTVDDAPRAKLNDHILSRAEMELLVQPDRAPPTDDSPSP
jgi:hypothetical protein